MNIHIKPRANRDGVIIRRLENETIVYDRATHIAKCLDETTARVWDACDGEHRLSDIAAKVPGADAEVVSAIIDDLAEHDLVAIEQTRGSEVALDRRTQLLGMAGIAAIAAIPAPTIAESFSQINGRPCQAAKDCGDVNVWKCETSTGVKTCQLNDPP